MNYKKIVRSQNLRFSILKFLKFLPDSIMVRIQYWIKIGKILNLNNPQTFTEKLQWYKIYYKNPLMTICVDKYDVREYIENKGLGNILNECYGVYDYPEDIDFDKLPNKFVVKTTDGSGGQNVFICKDKDDLCIPDLITILNSWKDRKSINAGREWAYINMKSSRFLVEKYLESDADIGGLIDYKFFCFNGKVEFLYVIADRDLGDKCGLGVYTRDFKKMEIYRQDEKPLLRKITRPENFDEMVLLSESLSKEFPHVRIDLYNVHDKILFGEFTFYDGSGYMKFNPTIFDREIGELFHLPNVNN